MSLIDTTLPVEERDALLAEIREHLPAFLSAAAAEQPDPAGDVSVLLGLRHGDLRRVIAAHLALSDEVREFIGSLPNGLRSPLTSSIRPRVSSQAVRGGIDWGATLRRRAAAGAAATDYIIRPARRVFDIPENRALAFVLEELERHLRQITPGPVEPRTGVFDKGWHGEVIASIVRVVEARRHHWLRGVPAQRPDQLARTRLRAARTTFYQRQILAVFDLLDRFRDPSARDITDLLAQRYFEPQRDWLLFELVTALRIAREFAAISAMPRKSRLLVGAGRGPYARYVMPDGAEVHLWYQRWPSDSGHSALDDAVARHAIDAGQSRPDFVAQLRRESVTVDAVLLEAKASRNGSYLASGLAQLLSYLKERPALFSTAPAGWLVMPPLGTFKHAEATVTQSVWATDANQVAARLAERFGYEAVPPGPRPPALASASGTGVAFLSKSDS